MTALHAFCRSPQTIGHARPSHCATRTESPVPRPSRPEPKGGRMVAPIERLTVPQFANLIVAAKPTLTRKIVAVHLHHTWRPRRTDFRGRTTVEAMRRFHMVENGWSDIAQHLTIDPQGVLWTGRNWNAPPASQTGRNGTRLEGPFMIEMVGDFDRNAETLDGAAVRRRAQRVRAPAERVRAADRRHPFPPRAGIAEDLSRQRRGQGRGSIADVEQSVTALPAAEPAAPGGTRSTRARRARAPFRADAVLGSSVAAPWNGPVEDRTVPEGEVAGGAVARMSGVGRRRRGRRHARGRRVGHAPAARHQPDQGRAVAQRLVQDAARARSKGSSTRFATTP